MSLTITLKSIAAAAFVLMPEEGENLSEKTQEAYLLYRSGNVEQALGAFSAQAKAGDPAAMFALGAIYREGKAGKGPEAAEPLFKAAAEKDYAPAQYNLALIMMADPARQQAGVDWLRRSAEAGSRKGMLQMGIYSLEGSAGIKQDPNAALAWLTKAEATGMPEAKFYLGRMYQAGFGVKKSLPAALRYISESAESNVEPAMLYLAGSYISGGLGEKSVEKALAIYQRGAGELDSATFQATLGSLYEGGEVIEKDYEKALFWYEKAVSGGHAASYNKLGYYHQHGMGVAKDEKKALEFYRTGAELGVPVSMYNVAQMLDKGIGVDTPDIEGAAKQMLDAANTGMPISQFELAKRYLSARGVLHDPTAASAWLERAAGAGLADAQLLLAQLYEGGRGIPMSAARSAHWYKAAAEKGNPQAMFRIGQFIENGQGTKADPVKALAFYQGAAESGHEGAVERSKFLAGILSEGQKADAKAFRERGFRSAEEGGEATTAKP